jgi:hypothetical protein
MIVLKLTGGLGNQLFQYALGRYLATKLATELVIEDSFYRNAPKGVTPRQYELGRFKTRCRLVTTAERHYLRRYTNRFLRFAQKYVPMPGRYRYVREPLDHLMLEVRDFSGDLLLDGYWQSEAYFSGAQNDVRQDLTLAFEMSPDDLSIRCSMQATGSVSLHVRRGDYVTEASNLAWHGICSLDYYDRALGLIKDRVSQPHLFVFSDDMQWVKDNLGGLIVGLPCTYVDHNDEQHAVNDLVLMGSCRHHIIANSSFSWWGAWLNPEPDKIVIRPSTWLRQLPHMNETVCPKSWIAL